MTNAEDLPEDARVRAYARAAQWDPNPVLLRCEGEQPDYRWLAMWMKRGALKVASGGPTPDQALEQCHYHAGKVLGCP